MNSGAVDIAEELKSAYRLHVAGRLDEARACYEDVLRRVPRHGPTLALAGALALQLGETERAVERLAAAVDVNPDDASSWNNLGAAYVRLERKDNALAAYRRALELDPRHADAWNNLATVLRSAGRYREAVGAFDRALELSPEDAGCRRALAATLREAGDPWRTARELEAIAEDARDADAWMELAAARAVTGDPAGAARAWREALDVEPRSERAALGLAESLGALERHDEAVALLEASAAREDRNPRFWLALGNAHLAAAQWGRAEVCFERSVERSPGDSSARLNLGIARLKDGRAGEAAVVFRGLRDEHPDRTKVRYYEGLAALQGGDIEGALAFFESALGCDPLHVNSTWYRGHCLRELGRDEQAREVLDPAASIHAGRSLEERPEGERRRYLESLADYLVGYPLRSWEPAGKTTRGGFQTASLPVHEAEVLRELRAMIAAEVDRFRQALPADHRLRRQWPPHWTLDAWGTILHRGGHQKPHIHPGGFLSGVFYVDLPPPDPADPQAGWIEFGGLPYETPAEYEAWTHRVEPFPGLMVLFPSYLPHSTVPFESDYRRVSLAFDVLPSR